MSKNDDEVLVRVESVSKKFCRSLKKSLWYGVCDIASELNPFGRTAAYANSHKNLTTDGSDGHGYGTAGGNQQADSGEFLEGHSQAALQMDSEKLASIRSANDSRASGEQTGSDSESVFIREISGKKSSSGLVTRHQSPVNPEASLRDGEFFAVKDVSFELRRGECLGLIGHNGAGKTTLLKMLNGLIKPDAGTITMRGRVGALIALGAGFNPILTGRENIYINGSVLGLTKKEIDEKIDEIIDFSEIREFIDAPVQTYSSGMTVRLGFAVATALDPDVLILDEVLAVGDASFRYKCYQRIDKLRKNAAIIFVSHNMPDIGRICGMALVMERGRRYFYGLSVEGVKNYNKLNKALSQSSKCFKKMEYPVTKFEVSAPETLVFNEDFDFTVSIETVDEIPECQLTFGILNAFGGFSATGKTDLKSYGIEIKNGETKLNCKIPRIPLKNDEYQLLFHIIDKKGQFLAMDYGIKKLTVTGADDGLPGECLLSFQNVSEVK
jgi:lipopolysaccharide transport system ATP-binding protein